MHIISTAIIRKKPTDLIMRHAVMNYGIDFNLIEG